MCHTLKTDHEPFQEVIAGRKTFEIRKADRDFRVGDRLHLLETVSTGAQMAAGAPLEYTGGETIVCVLGIMRGPVYGLADGWCVMSIEEHFSDMDYGGNMDIEVAASPTASPADRWIPVGERLPDQREKPYQVFAICAKTYGDKTCYPGEGKRGVYQDWAIRSWPQNYTHWCEMPPIPATEAPKE